ncbi:hypothetical protein niasHT_031854 [Heterodera trifolii]|uniref:Methyltransferase FkbM domain-containing protein n=1 Tax=Heterodera trifolii TaxID=157864 RepID=A0ABD2I2S2_9BILA
MTNSNTEYTPMAQLNDAQFEHRIIFQSKSSSKWLGLFMKCILMMLIAAFVYVLIRTIASSKNISKKLECPKVNDTNFLAALVQQQRGLVDVRLKDGSIDVNGTWTQIQPHFNQIWKEQMNKANILQLNSSDEFKYFMRFCPNVNLQKRTCTIVTFGVGHTVRAERELIKIYPECHLVAADPSAEINANLTQSVGGTFVQGPIGAETANQQPVISWEEHAIERKLVTQIGIIDFMNNHTKWEHEPVDLLLMDIEGAEFGIIELFAYHFERFTGSICQINIEVHDPNTLIANYTHQQFFQSFDTLIRSGQFALMNTDMYTASAPLHLFLRLFFVNVVDEKCTKKFLC